MPKAKDSLSYTTIEVLLIIILMGIWLGITLPRFGGLGLFDRSRLNSTVYNVASDIRQARGLAITNAATYIIDFDFTNNEYKIYKNSVAPANQIGDTHSVFKQITLSGTNQFSFSSLGSAGFPGSGIITLLVAGADQYNLSVIPATGAVKIQKI